MTPNLHKLAEKIREYIKKDFEEIHLSRNLMDTIVVYATENGFSVDIPAELYDIDKYLNEGVVVYTGGGSYAQEVNQTGGWSGEHEHYVEYSIKKAIFDWVTENEYKIKEYYEL